MDRLWIDYLGLRICLMQGSQHFMKMSFPDIFPDISLRKFQNSRRNIFTLIRLLGSQEVVLANCGSSPF